MRNGKEMREISGGGSIVIMCMPLYSQHLISLYHSSHWSSYSLILPLNERIRLHYHMQSFFLIRVALSILWHDRRPSEWEKKRGVDTRKWEWIRGFKWFIVQRHHHAELPLYFNQGMTTFFKMILQIFLKFIKLFKKKSKFSSLAKKCIQLFEIFRWNFFIHRKLKSVLISLSLSLLP